MYCNKCGKEINDSAVFCNYCGSQIKTVKVEVVRKEVIAPKSKTAAVVLAVFLSFWSWLYTYTKSSRKFWASVLGLSAWYVFLFVYSFTAIFTGATLDFSFNASWYLHISIIGVIWLWPVMEYSIRPKSFYEKYPKG